MNDLIEADHYEDFAYNGIKDCNEMFCESCYEDGFTAYHIIEKELEE